MKKDKIEETMNHKIQLSFANLIPLGIVSTIIGGAAAIFSLDRPFANILLGLTGMLFGLVPFRYEQEKLEKRFAWLGIILSLASVIRIIFF